MQAVFAILTILLYTFQRTEDKIMPVSEAKKKANQKYDAKAYDKVTYRLPKGKKEKISTHVTSIGESENAFINRAIDETIERDCELI
jgi:hypothetical protein